ncbi:hypothetical protein Misp01_09360 [Microtetraspora sp. NBRC 13810]|nr:hypothetical protein Misp01_09360 [Microtetraspora sp. NBRC 13810]
MKSRADGLIVVRPAGQKYLSARFLPTRNRFRSVHSDIGTLGTTHYACKINKSHTWQTCEKSASRYLSD